MSEPGSGARPGAHEVIVERSISVPLERAYGAWEDAAQIGTWFSPETEQDVRVGGRYRNSDGDTGEYLEVVPGRLLRFSWEQPKASPGSTVLVEFEPEGDDVTTVRLTHTELSDDAVMEMQMGWEWALDSLKSYLETGQPVSHEDWLIKKEMGYG